MDYYDVTAPGAPLTGKEKSVADLARPDERIRHYAGYSVEELQAAFIHIDKTLGPKMPEEIVKRLAVAKNLAVYGWFQWEFFTVSLFWSLSTIEMALKQKLVERFGGTFNLVKKSDRRTLVGSFEQLEEHLRDWWRIDGLPRFNGSFRSLLAWARDESVLAADTPVVLQELRHRFNNRFPLEIFPERARADGLLTSADPTIADIKTLWESLSETQRAKYQYRSIDVLVEEVPDLRNRLAHPASFNMTLIVRSAVEGYAQAVEIVNRLWPK